MGQSFRPIGGDDQLRIHAYQVTAGQTIAVGDPVFLDAGLLKVATTTTPALLGIAAEACTAAAAGTKLGVYDSPNLRCLVNASLVDDVLAAKRGTVCDIAGTTGAFKANLGASAIKVLRVIQLGVLDGLDAMNPLGVLVQVASHQLAQDAKTIT
jgi:hypothetical protein